MAQLELAVAEMELPQTDLSPIQEQLVGLELRVVDLAEAIEDTRGKDFELINSELGSLSSSFATMAMPDLNPVEHLLASVERAVSNIRVPEPDLSSLHVRLERLERQIAEPDQSSQAIYARLAGLEAAIDAIDLGPVDFSPVQSRISSLENLIATVRSDVQGIPSLEPIERQLLSLQQSVMSIPQPDLAPRMARKLPSTVCVKKDGKLSSLVPNLPALTMQSLSETLA